MWHCAGSRKQRNIRISLEPSLEGCYLIGEWWEGGENKSLDKAIESPSARSFRVG